MYHQKSNFNTESNEQIGGGPLILDGGLATYLEYLYRNKKIKNNKNCQKIEGKIEVKKDFQQFQWTHLWSSQFLVDDSRRDLIREVHLTYFRAGADVGLSCSYQACIEGFQKTGYSIDDAKALMRKSIQILVEARDQFYDEYIINELKSGESRNTTTSTSPFTSFPNRIKPLIALSLGPYGAILADGSEYTGIYPPDITDSDLYEFHLSRLRVYESDFERIDFVAFETIPSSREASIICQILKDERFSLKRKGVDDKDKGGKDLKEIKINEKNDNEAGNDDPTIINNSSIFPQCWISFSCRDSTYVSSGEMISTCIRLLAAEPKIWGVGVNCTKPQHINGLLRTIRETLDQARAMEKWIVCYPDAGCKWDTTRKEWLEGSGIGEEEFGKLARQWVEIGSRGSKEEGGKEKKRLLIGGCCKTTPKYVESIRREVFKDGE
ncbi:hypothetical protein G9A89_014874 [Geosiphon pyriformis]|nr:hypothetical protein G9A89_014874 [Geosiphon pyriformis]